MFIGLRMHGKCWWISFCFYVKFIIHRSLHSETLLSRLEIVGPIPLDESQRFLVLMSSGLCKILQDIHKTEQHNINRELIQLIVQQFRTQNSLTAVSQSSVEKLLSIHCANYMQQENNAEFKSRPDATLMIRNFNYPLPNEVRPPQNRNNVCYLCHTVKIERGLLF